jgi:hypothetical protein
MGALRLDYLTDDPVLIALAADYWAQDDEGGFPTKVADLAARYSVRASDVAKTVAQAAIARSTESTCSDCGEGRSHTSRSDYTQRRNWQQTDCEWLCTSCASELKERQARDVETRRAEQQGALRVAFGLEVGGVLPVGDMTLEGAITLLAVIRVGADEQLETIQPIGDKRLSPFGEYDSEILSQLFASRHLRIDPTSNVGAFAWEEDDPARYFPFQVAWQISDGGRRVRVADAQAALETALRGSWSDEWHAERAELWTKIALNECLEYLRVSLADHGLDKKMGEKTRHVIENALRDFSIGQVYSFIWRAAKDAAAFYLREQVTKTHAANTVVLAIERSADRALANGWDVASYRRDRRAPESPLSQLFAVMAQLGDRYWTDVPGRTELRSVG